MEYSDMNDLQKLIELKVDAMQQTNKASSSKSGGKQPQEP